jgi:MFS transporter, ACS family, glucarate transporter
MKKYFVLASLFVLSLITYIDRTCISLAKVPIAADLTLSDQAMGAVFSAFALGYALAQMPGGWMADKFGPRLALTAVVIAWSFFTGLTGAVTSFSTILAVRFLFGACEAGAFPGSARAIYNWLPTTQRGIANGILFSGSRIGAALSFPLLAWMLEKYQWRSSFVILAMIGVIWAFLWFVFFRDHAAEKPTSEIVQQSSLDFKTLFRSRLMLLTMWQYFASNFTFFICLTWMLPYLKSEFSLTGTVAANYAMIPLLCGAAAQWIAGFTVDSLFRAGWGSWSRQIPAMIGFGLAVVGLFALPMAHSPAATVACFALATFGADLTLSPSWSYCLDIGGANSGLISGAMNMVGNIGAFVSANAFPFLIAQTGSANSYFIFAGILNLSAIVCWYFCRTSPLQYSER